MSQQETAVVAKGRTIMMREGAIERDKNNPLVILSDTRMIKYYKPGDKIRLDQEEVKSLRQRGFLVDPNAKEVQVGQGPEFKQQDGVKVTQQ